MMGMKPSTDRTERLVVQYWNNSSGLLLNSTTLLQMYRLQADRWSAVTDEGVSTTPHEHVLRCKCAETGYRKKWRSIDTAWQVDNWTEVEILSWPWLRGNTARCGHQWRHDHCNGLPHRQHEHLSVSAHCLVSSRLSVQCHSSRTLTMAQVMSLVFVIHVNHNVHEVSVPLRPCSHLLPHAPLLPHSFHLFSQHEASWTPAAPPKRVWTCLTSPSSAQVMSSTPTTSRRLLASPT